MIGVTVNKSGRFVTNPEAVKHDIAGASERGLFLSWKLVRKGIIDKLSEKGTRDPFLGRIGTKEGLMVRTGKTRASITPAFRPLRIGGRVTVAVGSPDQHVADLEAGGTVSAGQGYFRIPLAAAQTRAGVDRLAGQSIRNVPGFYLRRLGAGKDLYGMKDGRPFYLFKKSITRVGRHIFARTAKESEPGVVAAVGREVSVAVARANQ